MITLYQVEWCQHCHRVRQTLTELGLTYTAVNVPFDRTARHEVHVASGQEGVPVLVDGETVLTTSDDIIKHLRATYPAADDADQHATMGDFRWLLVLKTTPAKALTKLKKRLAREGFTFVQETRGPELSPSLPADYVLLHVAVPAAAAKAAALDASVASAMTTPLAVYPVERGTAIAVVRPLAGFWLFGDPELLQLSAAVTERMVKVLEAL
jgi:glutaredoxin